MKTQILRLLLLSLICFTNITFAMTPLPPQEAHSIRGLACGYPEIVGTGPWCSYATDYVPGCESVLLPYMNQCPGVYFSECKHEGSNKVIVDRPIQDGQCISDPASLTCCTTVDVSPCVQFVYYECNKTEGIPAVTCWVTIGNTPHFAIDKWTFCRETRFDVKFPDGTHKMAVECL